MNESCKADCCDFCKNYRDRGDGSKKRNYFSGVGVCTLTGKEILASDGCEMFDCAICASRKDN